MRRLQDLVRSLEEQSGGAPPIRPNSLHEAGRVGSPPGERPQRREVVRVVQVDSASEPTAEERTTRRVRPPAGRDQAAQPPQAVPLTARQNRATLQNPESFRTAIMLREVLDPPLSRRLRRH